MTRGEDEQVDLHFTSLKGRGHVSGSKQIKVSRREFVGLGLSAALLSSGISPFVAKAQTVNFNAATTGKLSDYCRGDGSDETEQIQKCFSEHLFVEIDEPPAGVGYGIRGHAYNGGGVYMWPGQEVNGRGANSKLLRVGKWQKDGKCLFNLYKNTGASSIKLNNIYIEGFRHKSDVPNIDSDADSTAIAIRAREAGKWCNDIQLTGVQVHNWPGKSINIRNGSNVTFRDVKSVNPARGGITFYTSKNLNLLRVKSFDSGDDAFAFYAEGVPGKPATTRYSYGITMKYCQSYTRYNPQYGAALKFEGAREALVTNSRFSHAKNSLVYLASYPGGFHPTDIRVYDCKMLGGRRHSFQIVAGRARLISARRNYMYRPAGNCVFIRTPKGGGSTFDVTITGNTLVKPGSGKFIVVQDNISGVYTKRNTLKR